MFQNTVPSQGVIRGLPESPFSSSFGLTAFLEITIERARFLHQKMSVPLRLDDARADRDWLREERGAC